MHNSFSRQKCFVLYEYCTSVFSAWCDMTTWPWDHEELLLPRRLLRLQKPWVLDMISHHYLAMASKLFYVLPFALLMTIYNLDCTPRIQLLKIKVEASSKGVITFTVCFIMRHSFPAESMFISYHIHSWKSLCYNIRCPLPGWLL
jgi:hypothetical protein